MKALEIPQVHRAQAGKALKTFSVPLRRLFRPGAGDGSVQRFGASFELLQSAHVLEILRLSGGSD